MLANDLFSYYLSANFVGFLFEIVVILIIYLSIRDGKNSFAILFETMYEKASDFFSEVLGEEKRTWLNTYVTGLFFIILLSNLFGIIVEILSPMFGVDANGDFILEHYVIIPSGDINFNLALAVVSIIVILYMQFKSLGAKHFLYDYFPIFGKGYITIERGDKSAFSYYPTLVVAKAFDIIISLFLGLLEIIGLIAKIISLSFRLFGNMTSGTILLAMAVVGISSLTTDTFGFNFPIGLPVLIYLQEILVALIQALVFPLLVSIFIKVATVSSEA